MKLLVEKISGKAMIPYYAHKGDAGLDLFSTERVVIKPMERKLISTGIRVRLPENTEAQIRPRSGLAIKYGLTLLNSPGTIDQNYRGEIKVIMINLGEEDFRIEENMKIAQMVIKPVERVQVEEVESINTNTERGEKGFGSTGI